MKNESLIAKLRLDDEILSAIMSGKGYKPLKLSNNTLTKLKDTYECQLEECNAQINDYYYHGGQVLVDVDNALIFRYNGIELALSNDKDFDRDSFGELLLTVASVYMRLTYRDAVDLLQNTINENTAKVTLDGISSLKDKILEDPRFASNLIDGVDLDSDDEDTPPIDEDDDLLDEDEEAE